MVLFMIFMTLIFSAIYMIVTGVYFNLVMAGGKENGFRSKAV